MGNLPRYYKEKLNFGATLSTIRGTFLVSNVAHFEKFDSLKWIHPKAKFGLSLGMVCEYRLHDYLVLRTNPNISFIERHLEFNFESKKESTIYIQKIRSSMLIFPLDLKLRSKRVRNFSSFILFGFGYSLDLASQRNVKNIIGQEIIKVKRDDFFIEGGTGVEFYLEYFKFGIEIKVARGLNNLLIKDNTIFSNPIEKLNSKLIFISLTFEG